MYRVDPHRRQYVLANEIPGLARLCESHFAFGVGIAFVSTDPAVMSICHKRLEAVCYLIVQNFAAVRIHLKIPFVVLCHGRHLGVADPGLVFCS